MANTIEHKPLKTSPAEAMLDQGLEVEELPAPHPGPCDDARPLPFGRESLDMMNSKTPNLKT